MFTPILTVYGQSLISTKVFIQGVILLYDYISDIHSLVDYSSYTVDLDIESAGNFKGNIVSIKIQDLSSNEYQARTILFYVLDQGVKKIVAGYSQEDPILRKTSTELNLFLTFDFSIFTHGYLLSSIQASPTTASHNSDGLVHIEDPNISIDNTYSVYNKQQVDSLFSDFSNSLSDVATSGDYEDLINTPVNVSEFNNDSGYITENQAVKPQSLIGPYVICETLGNQVKKEVVLPNFSFQTGSRLLVKFNNANTASNPTLCIYNGDEDITGETYPLLRYGNYAVGGAYQSWASGQIIELIFDGSNWIWSGYSYYSISAYSLYYTRNFEGMNYNGTSNITHYGVCSTASNVQIKDVTIQNFNVSSIYVGSRVIVKFSNGNTAITPQLRVNSSSTSGTSKPIKARSYTISSSSNFYKWQPQDVLEFVYDGSSWIWVGFQNYTAYSESSEYTYSLIDSQGEGSSLYSDYYYDADDNESMLFITNSDFIPEFSNSTDLGKIDHEWKNIYTKSLNIDSDFLQVYSTVRTITVENENVDIHDATLFVKGDPLLIDEPDSVSRINQVIRYTNPEDTTEYIDVSVSFSGIAFYPNKIAGTYDPLSGVGLTLGKYQTNEWSVVYAKEYGGVNAHFYGTLGNSSVLQDVAYLKSIVFKPSMGTTGPKLFHNDNDTSNVLYLRGTLCNDPIVSEGNLGSPDNKWGYLYSLYLGSSAYPITTGNITTLYSTTIGSTSNKVSNLYVTTIGSTSSKVANIYATSFNGDLSGNATTSTTSQGLKKTVSSTDYTITLTSNNWVSNTNFLPSVTSSSTSIGKDLGSTSYKWRYLYANYLGTTDYKITSAYIVSVYGTLYGNVGSSTNYDYSLNSSNIFVRNSTGAVTITKDDTSSYARLSVSSGIRPSSTGLELGTSAVPWDYIYVNEIRNLKNINFYLLAISCQVSTSQSTLSYSRGDTLNVSGDSRILYVSDASLHIYNEWSSSEGRYDRNAYANGSYNTPTTLTGSFKLLGGFSCTNDNAYRTFIIPALKIS